MENQELYDLRNEFLKTWPLERVERMAIDEYTNLNKDDSFCYWLEKKTERLGSIWGGSSFKFGIYKRKNTDREFEKNAISDGEYAWLDKYGKERDEAFNNVKNIIVDIIKKSQVGDFKAIDSIDLGNATRWKITYLYSDNHILNVFSKEKLLKIAKRLGIEFDKNISFYNLQKLVLEQKTTEEDYFTFAQRIWEVVEKDKIDDIISLLHYKPQIILQGPPGTGKTREAKRIAKALLGLGENDGLESNEQFKLIQFHPSYSYEDFVRGIVAKPNEEGNGIVYTAENKILGTFAKEAFNNWHKAQQSTQTLKEEEVFEAFIEHIKEELAQSEDYKYPLTEAVYLFDADDKRFKYKGDNWEVHSKGLNMKFSEIKKIIDSNTTERKDIIKNYNLEALTRQMSTYFLRIVEKYYEFRENYKPTVDKIPLKNYVLVIDEINCANLSAVLGELIYALEYRGEAVQSMYAIDRENNLTLPPNLYIIGTMNTADRSVGHIDYAIRRRFAFVNILPKDLTNELGDQFEGKLFAKVTNLFNTNLSPEFKKEEVQLGHSYFITKNTPIGIRWEYEIKPILLEYVKDGILVGEGIGTTINNLINNENNAS